MKVFISWSGEPAKQIASVMRSFVQTVFAGRAQPFMSEHDIEKGARFGSVLNEELGATDTGLLILTSQNQRAPWLVFEAGALSKSLVQSRVIPLVVDLEHADPNSPLGQFQDASIRDEEAVWTVVEEINRRLDEPVPDQVLRLLFDASWPALQVVVATAIDALAQPEEKASPEDTLAEILDAVRGVAGQQQRLSNRVADLERGDRASRSSRNSIARGAVDPKTAANLAALNEQIKGQYAGQFDSIVESLNRLYPNLTTSRSRESALRDATMAAQVLAEQEAQKKRKRTPKPEEPPTEDEPKI